MPSLVLRRALDNEGDRVADLWLKSRRASVPQIPPPVHSDAEIVDWFTTVVLQSQEVWVAETASELVAVMALAGEEIEQLYVHPSWTGRGLGSHLVALAQDRHARLHLWTFEANTDARRFYEQHGFVAVARTGGDNEEVAPDMRYEWAATARHETADDVG